MSQRRAGGEDVSTLQGLLAPTGGGQPRIAPVRPRQLRPLARIVAEIGGGVTSGGPPNIFTTLGQHPRLFRAWLRYSAHLMPFGLLPRRDTELVILRVAWQCRSAYEWHQHVPIALRSGLTRDEVAGIARGPATAGFTPRQQTLLSVTDDLVARRALSETTWIAVRENFDRRETIELCLLVGHYQGLASAIGGLGIQVERGAGPSAGAGVVPADGRDDHSPMAARGAARTVTEKRS